MYMQFIGPNFLLQIPTNWLVLSSNQYQTIWLSPELMESSDLYANMSLLIVPLEEGMTSQQYIDSLQVNQSSRYPGFQQLANNTLTIASGEQGSQIKIQWKNPDKNMLVEQVQSYFIQGDRIFVFTGTRSADLEQDIADLVDSIFDTMIDSLRFENLSLFA